jgi:hypothetical protein
MKGIVENIRGTGIIGNEDTVMKPNWRVGGRLRRLPTISEIRRGLKIFKEETRKSLREVV